MLGGDLAFDFAGDAMAASIGVPVSAICLAREVPTSAARRAGPPHPGTWWVERNSASPGTAAPFRVRSLRVSRWGSARWASRAPTAESSLHMIRIGDERYEIPDAVVFGG